MDDKSLAELQLRMIAPGQANWPKDTVCWQALNSAVVAARKTVAQTWERIDAIRADADLTAEAKAKRCTQVVVEGVDALESHSALNRAREAANEVLARCQAKIAETIAAPEGAAAIAIAAEIRSFVRNEIGEDRLAWLVKNGDPRTLAALIHAPRFLSGLGDDEMATVRKLVESKVDPKIIATRDAIGKALDDVERGFRAARVKITQKVDAAMAA